MDPIVLYNNPRSFMDILSVGTNSQLVNAFKAEITLLLTQRLPFVAE